MKHNVLVLYDADGRVVYTEVDTDNHLGPLTPSELVQRANNNDVVSGIFWYGLGGPSSTSWWKLEASVKTTVTLSGRWAD